MAAKAAEEGSRLRLLFWLCLLCVGAAGVHGDEDRHYSVLINPGDYICFHEEFKKDLFVDVQYQVVKGGDLDISFYLAGPQPTGVLASNYKHRDGFHEFTVEVEGEYQLCFDNSFSTFSEKVVYFEIFVESDMELFEEYYGKETNDDDAELEISIELMREATDSIRANLTKVTSEQNYLKMRERRHKFTAEGNLFRVNFFSLLYLVVMVTVSFVQVYVLKRLFRERRRDKIRT